MPRVKKPVHRGRPPAGRNGEPRSAMRHQITARVPDQTYAKLKALAALLQQSQAAVLELAMDALEGTLPAADRKILDALKRRTP